MSFDIKTINAELFSDTADQYANKIYQGGLDRSERLGKNKPTQLRRFYDEICMWQDKIGNDKSKFDECLPFIKMINAKVAYAKGRDLVDSTFENMIREGFKQITDIKTFNNFKTFFEAVLGFYKSYAK